MIGKGYDQFIADFNLQGLIDWIVNTMLHKENNISAADLNLIPLTDDPEEVVRIIRDFYQDHEEELSPNYSLD